MQTIVEARRILNGELVRGELVEQDRIMRHSEEKCYLVVDPDTGEFAMVDPDTVKIIMRKVKN